MSAKKGILKNFSLEYKVYFSICVPERIRDELDARAKKTGRSRSFILTEILERAFAKET